MSSSSLYLMTNLDNAILYIYKYVLPMLYILGNIGNLLSALIFSKKSWKKNVCVFYFKICLFFNTCYINSTTLGLILINGFDVKSQNDIDILCKIYLYSTFLFDTLTPTVLILASVDRLLISSQNVDTRLYSSKRLAYFSITLSTFFWIIFNLHILIKVSIQQIYPSHYVCYYNLSKFYLDFVAYSSTVIHIMFFLLMIILCIFAFKNVRRIRTIPRDKRHQIRSMTKKDFQLLRCLFVQDILFIMFGMLIIIFYIYSAITKNQVRMPLEQAIYNFFRNFLTFLYNIPYCTNFFVFVIVSKSFRHELNREIYKIIGKDLAPMREEENRQEIMAKNNIEINVVSTVVLKD